MKEVKSLQELSFTHILMTLEEHAADDLALLPIRIRKQILEKLPIVDICQLEDTKFMVGISKDSIWEQLYKDCIKPHSPYSFQMSWKDRVLESLYRTLINDERPYGYSQVMSRSAKSTPWVGSDMTEDRPVHEHPMDIVNYLVATKHDDERLPKCDLKAEDCEEDEGRAILRPSYGPANVVMKRHEVTLVKGIVPPGALYNKACRPKQLVPPRYGKFFPENSCFLPDFIAIELLSKRCNYFPKEITIHVPKFGTFLENAKHEKSDLSYLAESFKEVNSLSIIGEVDRQLKSRVICEAKSRSRIPDFFGHNIACKKVMKSMKDEGVIYIEDVPSRVIEIILSNVVPRLTNLSITVSRKVDDVTESISPILSSSFSGLKEFHVHERGSVSPNIQRLISITEYQPMLHTISISICEITRCFGSFGPVVKSTPQFSYELLHSWIQICFSKPSLYNLKLALSPTSAEVLLKIVIAFLSTPCSHDQTLTFSCISLPDDKTGSIFGQKSGNKLSMETSPSKSCIKENLPSHQFEEACTLSYKSLVFHYCNFESSFTNLVFNLKPLKLKQFVINDCDLMGSSVLSRFFQQPHFDVQSMKISSMDMADTTLEDYTFLLDKKSLMMASFVHCSAIDPPTIRKAAKLRGFHLEEKSEIVYEFEKNTFILTRN